MSVNEAAAAAGPLTVCFWGVRGSIACPGAPTLRYGGNTPCVEIRCGGERLIFDAGTGIRALGRSLCRPGGDAAHDIFLSHCHLDHVIGLPFFAPMFEKGALVRVWAGNLRQSGGVEDAMRKLMSFPLFPLQVEALQARLEFRDFHVGDALHPRPGVTLKTAALHHPGGATGYRVEYGGRAVAYLTDLEMGPGDPDPALVDIARGAALVIVDATYTDDELPSHRGWGHSSWQQGVRLAAAAGVERLCLFHHDPDHDDAFMDGIAAAAEAMQPGTIVAREGMTVTLPAMGGASIMDGPA